MTLMWFAAGIAVLAAITLPLLLAAEVLAWKVRRPAKGWLMLNEREEFAPVQVWLDWWHRGARSAK
ncbi:MAG: hypothetical protein ACRD2E_08010 [Terriglobales bacterium]